MSNDAPAALETAANDASTDLEPRDVRALTEVLTVLPDQPEVAGADELYLVVSESGSEYTVDARDESCTCPDAVHRDATCKHQRRVAFATGERAIPAWVDSDDVDDGLGEHIDGGVSASPVVAATDGGTDEIVVAGDQGEVLTDGRDDQDTDDVDGAVYTYHWESYAQGGARYVRCERCGVECVPADPDCLAHREGCPEGR